MLRVVAHNATKIPESPMVPHQPDAELPSKFPRAFLLDGWESSYSARFQGYTRSHENPLPAGQTGSPVFEASELFHGTYSQIACPLDAKYEGIIERVLRSLKAGCLTTLRLCLQKFLRYVTCDFKRFRDCSTLRHKALNVVARRQVYALRKPFDMYIRNVFHGSTSEKLCGYLLPLSSRPGNRECNQAICPEIIVPFLLSGETTPRFRQYACGSKYALSVVSSASKFVARSKYVLAFGRCAATFIIETARLKYVFRSVDFSSTALINTSIA